MKKYSLFMLACAAFIHPQLLAAKEPTFQSSVTSSADPRATEAGMAMLRQGGSAADATMAMMVTLSVVEPQSSGIGGGGFLVYSDGSNNALSTINGRETAPAAADQARFLDAKGAPLPFLKAVLGGRSVGVPGNIRLMAMAHKKWGKLKWKQLFQPAIRLAEDGFEVYVVTSTHLSQPH